MLSWKDYYVQEQYRKDLLAEAEQARLVKLVSGRRESPLKKLAVRGLESLGSRLVRWGSRLLSYSSEYRLAGQN